VKFKHENKYLRLLTVSVRLSQSAHQLIIEKVGSALRKRPSCIYKKMKGLCNMIATLLDNNREAQLEIITALIDFPKYV